MQTATHGTQLNIQNTNKSLYFHCSLRSYLQRKFSVSCGGKFFIILSPRVSFLFISAFYPRHCLSRFFSHFLARILFLLLHIRSSLRYPKQSFIVCSCLSVSGSLVSSTVLFCMPLGVAPNSISTLFPFVNTYLTILYFLITKTICTVHALLY